MSTAAVTTANAHHPSRRSPAVKPAVLQAGPCLRTVSVAIHWACVRPGFLRSAGPPWTWKATKSMRGSSSIHIGTSGWHYDHWKGPFYPEDLPAERMLDYYCDRFRTVEVNNSFYQLPETRTLTQWRNTAPGGFVFSVKASRYITHMKKLKDPVQSSGKLLERAAELKDKLGPVLFQLPPRWRVNAGRLNHFLATLPEGHRYAFEFRDATWFVPPIYYALAKHRAAFCIYDLARQQSPKQVTADFVYVRLHGPGGPYQGRYDTRALAGWAGAFATWTAQGKEVYCYFDNDQAGYAPRDALALQEMVEG